MKKVFLTILVLSLFTVKIGAQDADNELPDGVFKLTGVAGLNFSQTALSNWSAGGENSVAGTGHLNASLRRKSGKWLWTNNLALEYGLTYTETNGTQKVSDRIAFSTQLGYEASAKWYYAVLGDLNTQFAKGYVYPDRVHYISKFFAPAYSNVSIGMDYRPNTEFSVYMSPLAGKLTFVQDDSLSNAGAFGVDPGDKFRAELGAFVRARAEKTIMTNVKLISTADFFTAYDSSFGNIDINWDLMLSMRINKFLSATVNTTLKYDDDVRSVNSEGEPRGPRIQFREMLGIGIAYNF